MENEKKFGVIAAISRVSQIMAQEGVSKSRKNKDQGYQFRGIDEVLNALSPMLVEAGLVIVPNVLSRECVERMSSNNKPLFFVTVQVQYNIYFKEDGTFVQVVTFGEAMDSSDKATNKAMSAAYKVMAIQTFAIPTEGENDADFQSPEPRPAAAPTGTPEQRAKAMPQPQKPNATIPASVLQELDALTDMELITAACSKWKDSAIRGHWDRELFRYWQRRDEEFKALHREVFQGGGDEQYADEPDGR